MPHRSSENTHKTTTQAIRVLDILRRTKGATISDLASEFEMPRSTLYTHLNTLMEEGFVVRENGQYWIGIRFKEFSVAAEKRKPSYQIVRSGLAQLEGDIDAETEFLIEEAGQVSVIYHSENIEQNRVRLHMHNTAAGKSILAERSTEDVEKVLDKHGLPQQTKNTITDREELFAELETIGEQGYAYNNAECFDGYHGIGATVQGIDGGILGAVTLGGPIYRIPENQLRNELVDTLLNTVDEIEETIEANRLVISSELATDQ
ncbi:IclR family transcriptional regulator [Halobacterium sp. KA-6]|uniref:IclR family transcriptional regulator n=1 Tax=Halobacterium sp. KA-6 TaxID=2896368 RepID=UPI001E32385B|nr:IclR family transcriptional regulator [Halobacterium sp. KA-6]MCD2205255.1 IclR family transcriptional regulator [Halobacterium sp. KA-6]